MNNILKSIYLLTILSCLPFLVNCQTIIAGGTVSGNWTKIASPYIIQGSIMIPNGQTLSIDPGVKVEFQGTYKLLVLGRLLAIGTKTDTINFSPKDTSLGWLGIRFDNTPNTNDTSKIIYCKLQYGKATGPSPDDKGGAIFINNYSKVLIANTLISFCKANNEGGGIYLASSGAIIKNNIVKNNSTGNDKAGYYFSANGGGISIHGGKNIIDNNIIINNTAGDNASPGNSGDGGGINFRGGLNTDTSKIRYNIISNNKSIGGGAGGGIYIEGPNGVAIVNNNKIYSNFSGGGGGGVFCKESQSVIHDNSIINNKASGSGGGVSFEETYPII